MNYILRLTDRTEITISEEVFKKISALDLSKVGFLEIGDSIINPRYITSIGPEKLDVNERRVIDDEFIRKMEV